MQSISYLLIHLLFHLIHLISHSLIPVMTVKNNFRTSFIRILETISAESNLALKISAGHTVIKIEKHLLRKFQKITLECFFLVLY